MKFAAVLVGFAACFAAGCSERATPAHNAPATNAVSAPAANTRREPSTMQTAIDGFTGRAAVQAGRQAQDKIRAVSTQRNADLEAAENMKP